MPTEVADKPAAPSVHDGSDAAALRAIASMRTRIRLVRAAHGAIGLGLYGAAFAVVAMLMVKAGFASDRAARRMLLASLLFPVAGAMIGWLRRAPSLLAAQLLDRAYGLSDRLASALEFRAIPAADRTPFVRAALDDADARARSTTLSPRRALAWRWPGETRYVLGTLALLTAVSLIEFRTRVVVPVHAAPAGTVRNAMTLTDDDVAAFREFARQMEQQATTDEAREAADRFNRFIDRLEDHQLDRQEALRQLQALQEQLEHRQQDDREALREALRELGNRMDGSDSARALAQALQQSDPHAAAEAMHQMAEQLRQDRMTAQQRQDLQHALERARQRENDDLPQRLQHARDEVERLLRQQRERQTSQDEQRNLRQRQRELERLNNQQQRREQQQRQLSRLDRAMSQAAQDLARDLAAAGQDLEQGAQDLNRMQNEQLSEAQIAELRQQLEDLRQRMRQQNGQGGQQQRMRLERFAGRARGGVMPGGIEAGGMRLRLMRGGSGGGAMPMPGSGQGPSQGSPGGQGNDPGGSQAGTGHDEHLRGASTSIRAHLRTVAVAGQQSGQGPSRSQIIRSAAQDGFTSAPYREVHAQYWDHAREVVHAGDVPPGYRAYVRRYFQLIRPRE